MVGEQGDLNGRVFPRAPRRLWCRSDLSLYLAARTVAHEARHAWQFGQATWRPPVGKGQDARAFFDAHANWRDQREQDASDYEQAWATKAEAIAAALKNTT